MPKRFKVEQFSICSPIPSNLHLPHAAAGLLTLALRTRVEVDQFWEEIDRKEYELCSILEIHENEDEATIDLSCVIAGKCNRESSYTILLSIRGTFKKIYKIVREFLENVTAEKNIAVAIGYRREGKKTCIGPHRFIYVRNPKNILPSIGSSLSSSGSKTAARTVKTKKLHVRSFFCSAHVFYFSIPVISISV